LASLPRQELAALLEARRLKKAKTPKFQRQESWRYVRIHEPWRKPKGIDSHMRLSVKGWPALVKIGYRGPKKTRGLHPSGYRDILVHNLSELEALSPKTDAARFAAGVGRRKRLALALKAKELGIKMLNGGDLLSGQQQERQAPSKDEEEDETIREAEVPSAEEEPTSAEGGEEKQAQSEQHGAEAVATGVETSDVQASEQAQRQQQVAKKAPAKQAQKRKSSGPKKTQAAKGSASKKKQKKGSSSKGKDKKKKKK
jgi:large subunit ribosomal protein L32e